MPRNTPGMATSPKGKKPAPRKTKQTPAANTKAAGSAVPARKAPANAATVVKHPGGAPSKYSLELVHPICEHIANCVSLRAIAAMDGMPSVQTMKTWLADDSKPEFLERYARAREAQADKMAEDILAIADEECTMVKADKHGTSDDDGNGNTEVVFDSTAVQRNKLRVDTRKWLASKMAPKKYGDKVAIGGADDLGPVQTITKEMTDAERAVRLSRAINDNPAALQALLAAIAKKGAAK